MARRGPAEVCLHVEQRGLDRGRRVRHQEFGLGHRDRLDAVGERLEQPWAVLSLSAHLPIGTCSKLYTVIAVIEHVPMEVGA